MVRALHRLTTAAAAAGPKASSGFSSRLHDPRVAAWLGIWLGASFTSAFVTGLISHFMQQPPGWLLWPSRPVSLYRVTQGLHVIGGLATIPLLLAKLWTVYPKLWQWPPIRSARHAARRALALLLVGGSLFQLAGGLFNIAYWYPFPFFFPAAHYWTSYLVMGALVIHVVNERDKILGVGVRPLTEQRPQAEEGLSRRGFFRAVAGACGLVVATTAGETVTPVAGTAVLAPRRPGIGPQGLPVNRTAVSAGVVRLPALAGGARTAERQWRLQVDGAVERRLSLSLSDLRALPRHTARLPISCVEGWSAEGEWAGVRLRDVLGRAGVRDDATVLVESMQRGGRYRSSEVDPPHWRDPLTLLALELNGEPLALDHGYPCRLIAPNRPGVMQTKWVGALVVS